MSGRSGDRHKNRTLKSEAERLRILRSASLALTTDDFVVEDEDRRARTEASALEFIKEYCTACEGGFLLIPPPKTMEKIITSMQTAVESLVPYHIMMPRGHGKSSYVKGICAWAIATGRRHFLEVVASNGKKAEGMLRDIFQLFNRSPKLLADYPEICLPIRKLEGKTQRCKSITVDGEPTDMKIAVDEMHFPRINGYPNSGAILLAVGFKANARGAVVGSQRPDLMVFDDLQDKEMAENPERVTKALEMIKGDFLGSAGHQGGMAVFMTSTPITADDLSEKISADPFWTTEVFRMLEAYPMEWELEEHGLWGEYATLMRNEGNARRNPNIACNAFYKKYRRQMDRGAKVLNKFNFKHTEVSAIQHAMNLLITSGEKIFDAEYQMKPHANESVFRLHPSQVLDRIRTGTPSGWMLPDKVMVIAATDINPSYAFTTSVVCFDGNRTAFVTLNFITPSRIKGNANDTEFYSEVYQTLSEVGQRLRDTGIPIDVWGIDCSGNQWQAVTDFVKHSQAICGLEAYALAGRTDKEFNPRIATRRRGVGQNDTVLCWNRAKGESVREYIYFNKDKYEESAQRAWLSGLGASGGLTLYDGGEDQNEFASQVCNEWMIEKVAIAQDKYRFGWKEGGKHDYGDAVYMTYALAGYYNIVPGGSHEEERESNADDFEIF